MLDKKKRVSMKTKKAWRKHVDIQDVDRFLDDQRLEERLGKSVATKADKELFVVDTAGKDVKKPKEPEAKGSLKKARRELLRNKEPKCFAILNPSSAVQDPISKRNFIKKPCVPRKRTAQPVAKVDKTDEENLCTDLWEKKVNEKIDVVASNEWLSNSTKKHTLDVITNKKRRLPPRKKNSVLPSIAEPHPGTSYNPSYEDHQELLQQIAADELKLIKEEKHLNRVTDKMFKKVTQAVNEKNNLKEMSQGLNLDGNDSHDETSDDDPELKSINPPTEREKKKTLKQRRKQKELLELKKLNKKNKIEKKKRSDVYKLNKLNSSIMKKEALQSLARKKREEKKEQKMLEPKVLSRHKFEPIEQEFQMADELSGSLRTFNPTGKLLKDRYKSLQQRNIVAPGTLHLKLNKPKVKKFIKPDHKYDFSNVKK